jgi:cytokinesis protein
MQQAKRFIDNINNIQTSVDSGNLSDPKKFHPQDRILQVLLPVLPEARKKAGYLKDHLEAMTKTYNDLLTYYGEDPNDESARKKFFKMIADFLKNYKVLSFLPSSFYYHYGICSAKGHNLGLPSEKSGA